MFSEIKSYKGSVPSGLNLESPINNFTQDFEQLLYQDFGLTAQDIDNMKNEQKLVLRDKNNNEYVLDFKNVSNNKDEIIKFGDFYIQTLDKSPDVLIVKKMTGQDEITGNTLNPKKYSSVLHCDGEGIHFVDEAPNLQLSCILGEDFISGRYEPAGLSFDFTLDSGNIKCNLNDKKLGKDVEEKFKDALKDKFPSFLSK
jgi:hypothetical protein